MSTFDISLASRSSTAKRLGIDNTLPSSLVPNAQRTLAALDRVVTLVAPARVDITSIYRSPKLNEILAGAKTSAHLLALAVDFTVQGLHPYEVVERMVKAGFLSDASLDIDQLIYEGSWVHMGFHAGAGRRQLLTYQRGGGYLKGLVRLGHEP